MQIRKIVSILMFNTWFEIYQEIFHVTNPKGCFLSCEMFVLEQNNVVKRAIIS